MGFCEYVSDFYRGSIHQLGGFGDLSLNELTRSSIVTNTSRGAASLLSLARNFSAPTQNKSSNTPQLSFLSFFLLQANYELGRPADAGRLPFLASFSPANWGDHLAIFGLYHHAVQSRMVLA